MNKHTPGPWKWDEGFGAIVAGDGPDMLVTPMWRRETTAWGDETNEANARLIAASPDLLEACKAALLQQSIHTACLGCDESLVAILRAAIAKAEGGAK